MRMMSNQEMLKLITETINSGKWESYSQAKWSYNTDPEYPNQYMLDYMYYNTPDGLIISPRRLKEIIKNYDHDNLFVILLAMQGEET